MGADRGLRVQQRRFVGHGGVVVGSRCSGRYYVRVRERGRLELTEVDDEHGDGQLVLFAANTDVLERFLYGLFGDDIRDEVGLPFLELPWGVDDIADGFQIDHSDIRYRILRRADDSPVAAAPVSDVSLLALVPLSHFLGMSVAALKRSFLAEDGAPLLAGRRYAQR